MDPVLTDTAISALQLAAGDTGAAPLTAFATALRVSHAADRQRYPWATSMLRSTRRLRSLHDVPGLSELIANPAYLAHVARAGDGDPLMVLSHRDYLLRGLTPRQRIRAALTHYRHEMQRFTPDYRRGVYAAGALVMWQRRVEGVDHDIVLMPGNDVAHEGGASLVMRVDGQRVCVLSYAMVPTDILDLGASDDLPETMLLITRKQSTRDRDRQQALGKAFARMTSAHLCFGALQGVALALGQAHLAGCSGWAQPSFVPELGDGFDAAYDRFWESMGGRRRGRRAWVMTAPATLPPLDEMSASTRKRARARRRHVDEVMESARAVLSGYLRP